MIVSNQYHKMIQSVTTSYPGDGRSAGGLRQSHVIVTPISLDDTAAAAIEGIVAVKQKRESVWNSSKT